MVNHYLLEDEVLLERYRTLIEESITIETNIHDEYMYHDFKPESNPEFLEVRGIILKRMKGER